MKHTFCCLIELTLLQATENITIKSSSRVFASDRLSMLQDYKNALTVYGAQVDSVSDQSVRVKIKTIAYQWYNYYWAVDCIYQSRSVAHGCSTKFVKGKLQGLCWTVVSSPSWNSMAGQKLLKPPLISGLRMWLRVKSAHFYRKARSVRTPRFSSRTLSIFGETGTQSFPKSRRRSEVFTFRTTKWWKRQLCFREVTDIGMGLMCDFVRYSLFLLCAILMT